MKRVLTATAATAFAASALLGSTAANAAPILVETETETETAAETAASSTCTITSGELSWGVKERFRSYISSSIANGSWEVADGATYETPLFGWSNASGEIDAETGEGLISFTGSIQFTGHDGVLDMTIANPSIELKGDGTARLLLDTRSNDPDGNLKLDEPQANLAKIDEVPALDPASGTYALTDAPGVLTAEGAIAFGDFYASGEEIDPLTLQVQFEPCEGAGGTAPSPEEETTEPAVIEADEPQETGVPWLPIILGAIAVLVIGVTGGMLIAGRKKTPAANQAPEPTSTDQPGGQ